MPIQKHYSAYSVKNHGEQAVSQMFDFDFFHDNDEWHVYHSLRIAYHENKKYGECDFLVINKRGILVFEVKGGEVEYKEGRFFRIHHKPKYLKEEFKEDPFRQADGNAQSVIRFLKEKELNICQVIPVVIFTQSFFDYQGISYTNFWHLGLKNKMIFRNFLLDVYKNTHIKPELAGKILTAEQLNALRSILVPSVASDKILTELMLTKDEAQLRQKDNVRILEGLSENKRLMIQGPPGSGKSMYAIERIQTIYEKNAEAKGLYICWNELLAAHIRQTLTQKGIDHSFQVTGLFSFVKVLLLNASIQADDYNYETIDKTEEFIIKAIDSLKKNEKLPSYDFMVIDEAQDMFDKGIDQLLENFLNHNQSGISNGEYYIFYDLLQSFNKHYSDTVFHLKQHSAMYTLYNSFRAVNSWSINELADDISKGMFKPEKNYGDAVVIRKFEQYEEIARTIKDILVPRFRVRQYTPDETIVLFSSNLIGEKNNLINPIQPFLNSDPLYELLTPENYSVKSDKIRYTTSLKFKGLERDVVILVLSDLKNDKIKLYHQFYIGATRAKAKLYIFYDEKDTSQNQH